MTLPHVIRAEYRGDHRIRVTFNDDSEKTIDFRQWLDGPCLSHSKTWTTFGGSLWTAARSSGPTGRTSLRKHSTTAKVWTKRPTLRLERTSAGLKRSRRSPLNRDVRRW
jgi:hypothetical protein